MCSLIGFNIVFVDQLTCLSQCRNICEESQKIRIKRERGAPTPVCGYTGAAAAEVPRGCCCSELSRPRLVSLTTRGNQSRH